MRSQDHYVILVRRTVNLGYWEFGMGRERGGVEEGEVSLRVTWDQGGRDPYHAKEGFQVSKRERKESNRELARGVKHKGIAP
jgi:hypothetical protein